MAAGIITPSSVFVRQGGRMVRLPITRTPLVAQVALAELLASGVEPCPVCDRYGCDCDEWHELMHTDPCEEPPCVRCHRYNCNCAAQPFNVDPHGDLTWRESEEVPF